MLQKLLTIVLIGLLVLTVACSNPQEESPIIQEEESTDPPVVVFAHRSVNSYAYMIMNEAMKKAVEVKGWTYLSSIADHDSTRQNQQIMNFIRQSPDAIIMNPIDSFIMEELIERGSSESIPMCTIDNTVSGNLVDVEVKYDNYRAGVMAGEKIVEELTEKFGKPKGVVFNGYGDLVSNAWSLRKEGFESVILQYPDIEYLALPTGGTTETLKDQVKETLVSGQHIDAIHVPSEFIAVGMVEALKETGNWYRKDQEGHIIIVTIDGEPYFVDLVKEGYADAIVVQDVISYGFIMVNLLNDYIFKDKTIVEGEYFSNTTYWKSYYVEVVGDHVTATIPPYLIDEENCEDKAHWAYKAKELWGFQYNR